MTFRSFVRPLFVALTLAFATTAAASAFADESGAKAAEHSKGKGKGKDKGKHHRKIDAEKFPMEGDKFTKGVDARVAKAKEKLEGALTKHGVAAAEKTKLLKEFDTGAEAVKAAAKKAAKDGTVSKEEAKDVRELVKNLRKQLRAKLPKKADKSEKGKTV
jgi:hypothetical protein